MTRKLGVGIDLGTSYSCVAYARDKKAGVLQNEFDQTTIPTCVAFDDSGRMIFGQNAKDRFLIDPGRTIIGIKRLIGRDFDDPVVRSESKKQHFKIVDVKNQPMIQIETKHGRQTHSPVDLSAKFLSYLHQMVNENPQIDEEIYDVVLTIPATFNQSQREASYEAATRAGLNVIRLLSEPTAAAIAYGFDVMNKTNRNVLIFDLGGGTFDITILNVNDGALVVKATFGNSYLGGDDFDQNLVDHIIEELESAYSLSEGDISQLKIEVEKAKRKLCANIIPVVTFDFNLQSGDTHTVKITREIFQEKNQDLFKQILDCISVSLMEASLTRSDIDEVLLVGGSSRIPQIQESLGEYFRGKCISKKIHPEEAVAKGAALMAEYLQNKAEGGRSIILKEALPFSIGVEIKSGIMYPILHKNTNIPVKVTKEFKTVYDHQEEITIKIFEGERPLTRDNNFLGQFVIVNLPDCPAGEARIFETFEVDEDGILKVSASVRDTAEEYPCVLKMDKGRLNAMHLEEHLRETEDNMIVDIQEKERQIAKHDLQTELYNLQSAAKRKEYVPYSSVLMNCCEEIEEWLARNQNAEKDEYISKVNMLQRARKEHMDKVEHSEPECLPYKGTDI